MRRGLVDTTQAGDLTELGVISSEGHKRLARTLALPVALFPQSGRVARTLRKRRCASGNSLHGVPRVFLLPSSLRMMSLFGAPGIARIASGLKAPLRQS